MKLDHLRGTPGSRTRLEAQVWEGAKVEQDPAEIPELAVTPARFVNIYTCKLALPYIAGYGTLPNEFREDDHLHGVIVDYGTLRVRGGWATNSFFMPYATFGLAIGQVVDQ